MRLIECDGCGSGIWVASDRVVPAGSAERRCRRCVQRKVPAASHPPPPPPPPRRRVREQFAVGAEPARLSFAMRGTPAQPPPLPRDAGESGLIDLRALA